jgi:glycosyltransferase involved in cell wall biosynthesis
MKKIIHVNKNLRPGGGPAGYLYNLKKLLKNYNVNSVQVYSFSESQERTAPIAKNILFLKRLPKYIREKIIVLIFYIKLINDFILAYKLDRKFDDSSIVFFHDQFLAYAYSKVSNKKFFVMPHQPVELTEEVSEAYCQRYLIDKKVVYDFYYKKELEVYEKAAGILLPHVDSVESYSFPYFKETISKKVHNIVSYCQPPQPLLLKNEVIDNNAFMKGKKIVGFFGRFNSHKGFDVFLDIVNACKDYEEVYFIAAGSGDIVGENGNNFYNFGWCSDIGSLISVCDLVVVPNRVAYFDLLPIEALLLGINVAVTNVGGSKFLIENLKGSGVLELNAKNYNIREMLIEAELNKVDMAKVYHYFNEQFFLNQHCDIIDKI